MGRNPLKSGQGFNLWEAAMKAARGVVIPLNRVKVSTVAGTAAAVLASHLSRNPLKSGQGFNFY